MKKGTVLFLLGLVMFMVGVYLSTQWILIGSILAVLGSGILGSSTYFLAMKK